LNTNVHHNSLSLNIGKAAEIIRDIGKTIKESHKAIKSMAKGAIHSEAI